MIFPIRSTSSLLKIPRYALTSLLINCCWQSQRHVDLNSRHLEGRLGVPLPSNDVHTFVQTCVLVVYCRSGTVLGTRRTMGKKRRLLSTVGCWMLMANHNRFLLQPHLNRLSPCSWLVSIYGTQERDRGSRCKVQNTLFTLRVHPAP